jgi:hypothetical protein
LPRVDCTGFSRRISAARIDERLDTACVIDLVGCLWTAEPVKVRRSRARRRLPQLRLHTRPLIRNDADCGGPELVPISLDTYDARPRGEVAKGDRRRSNGLSIDEHARALRYRFDEQGASKSRRR